jgi:hypothetical protein
MFDAIIIIARYEYFITILFDKSGGNSFMITLRKWKRGYRI